MESKFLPLHMTVSDRTERLYNFLVSMGLIADPIVVDGEIKSISVKVDLSADSTRQRPTHTSVSFPVDRSKIREAVATAQNLRSNVINFPTIL